MGICSLLDISKMEYFPVSWRSKAVIANWSFSVDKPEGRPPFLPLALAATSPALVRSRIISLSNSANEAKILNVNLPVAVVVSMWSCRLTKLTPFSLNTATRSTRWRRERPRRSNFQTTTWSPLWRVAKRFFS